MRKLFTTRFLIFIAFFLFTINSYALNLIPNSNYSKYNLIYANGRIHRGDLYRLKKMVKAMPRNKQTIVIFESTGGELNEGIKIGEFIYKNRIATAVKQNSICASSCAIAFLGGRDLYGRKMMILPSTSKLGYHSFYYKRSSRVNVSEVQKDLSRVVNYFSYVRAPNQLMSKMLNTKPFNMYWITKRTNRYLSLRKSVKLKYSFKSNKYTQKESNTYKKYRKSYSYSNQKETLKKYFHAINKAISSNGGYAYNNIAFNNNTTTYKFWLESNLNYVYVNSIKKLNSNTIEAHVTYSLKNGYKAYATNRYKLAKNPTGWYIVSKKIIPNRNSRRIIQSYITKLP